MRLPEAPAMRRRPSVSTIHEQGGALFIFELQRSELARGYRFRVVEVGLLVLRLEPGRSVEIDLADVAIENQVHGPVETLRVPDAGHAPHRDQPELVLERMTAFVQAIRAGNRRN